MTTETIIGFDSAWTDRVPGAICTASLTEGKLIGFEAPRLVRFDEAAVVVEEAASSSDYLLVAIDQPTLVPNTASMRPVERVAGSVVNAIGGGVQPANRRKLTMFGEEAPIWRFLDRIKARENPHAAREASSGRFLVEVFQPSPYHQLSLLYGTAKRRQNTIQLVAASHLRTGAL